MLDLINQFDRIALLKRNTPTSENIMTNQAVIIIKWAASETNGHGAHIDALTYALESGRVEESAKSEIEAKKSEWVKEHNNRFAA